MDELKRYNRSSDEQHPGMVQDILGKWVKYDDIADIIAERDIIYREFIGRDGMHLPLREALAGRFKVVIVDEERLTAEAKHWKTNHDEMVRRNAVLMQRPDLPVDRIPVYERMVSELAECKKERTEFAFQAVGDEKTINKLTADLAEATQAMYVQNATIADLQRENAALAKEKENQSGTITELYQIIDRQRVDIKCHQIQVTDRGESYDRLNKMFAMKQDDWIEACGKWAEAEKRIAELEQEVEALTECLNGSSKATYTAEVHDKMLAEARTETAAAIHAFISGIPTMDGYKTTLAKAAELVKTAISERIKKDYGVEAK